MKHFPLPNHRLAYPAAQAATAAQMQGKFQEYHKKVFGDYQNLTEEKFQQFAKDLGLDLEKFNKDRGQESVKQMIQRDLMEGRSSGVSGTPTVYINGRLLQQRSLGGMQQLIDKALAEINTAKKSTP